MPELDTTPEQGRLRAQALRRIEDGDNVLAGVGYALVRIGDLLNDLHKYQRARDNGFE